jgi:Chitobiase/beta-hexosaminidase C-terminal domain
MRKALWVALALAISCGVAAGQTAYSNLDDSLTGWQNPPCSNLNPPGSFCAGGSGTPGTSPPPSQTINNTSPSLDGDSMLVSFVGQSGLGSGQTTNVLWPWKAPSFDNNATYFYGIYHFYYPSVTNLQAQEADQFKFDNANNRYMMGLECDSASLATGKIRTWNQLTSSWVTQSDNCTILTSGTWHTLEMVTHTDPPSSTACSGHPCYHYDAVVQDGVTTGPYTAEPSAVVSETPNNGIQPQLDGSAAGGTVSEYIDEMSLTIYDSQPTAAAPTFSPVGGTYGSTQTVTLSTTSPVAFICYNTTGAPATNGFNGCTTGTLYTTPITVSSTETIYAVAGGPGYIDSSAASATYTISATPAPYVYLTPSGTATGSCPAGTASAPNFTPAQFNTSSNWGSSTGKIGPGTIVLVCGAFTGTSGSSLLTFQGSGTAGNVIWLVFNSGASFSAAYWGANGAINTNAQSYLLLDGGALCGWVGQVEVACNGSITATANGSALGNQQPSIGIEINGGSNVEVRNFAISNMFVQVRNANANWPNSAAFVAIDAQNSSNLLVHNNFVHDAHAGYQIQFNSGTTTNVQLYNNVSQNMCEGYATPSGGTSPALNGILIHDNESLNGSNWDDSNRSSPACHEDHFHGWAEAGGNGGTVTGMQIYDNYFHGDLGCMQNGYVYFEADVGTNTGALIYNNLLVNTSNNSVCTTPPYAYPPSGYIGLKGGGTGGGCAGATGLYNNTIVGNTTLTAQPNIGILIENSCANVTQRNNTITTVGTALVVNDAGSSFATSNNGNYYNLSSSPFNYKGTGEASFAAWQAACSCDANSGTTNPNLSSSYVPNSGSPLIGAAVNLNLSLGNPTLAVDAAGYNRAPVAAWDIGAFVFSSAQATPVCAHPGPPNYYCSSNSTANPGAIAPIFISGISGSNPATCTGMCQNSTAYDTTLNPAGIDCITRLTDGTTFPSGASVGNFTFSGGDNDIMGSVNETYLGIDESQIYIFHMTTNAAGCAQVMNTGTPGIHVSGPFGFSKVTDTRFYYLKNETQLWRGDITSDSAYTPTEMFDLTGATGPGAGPWVPCPGVNWGAFGPSSFTVTQAISAGTQTVTVSNTTGLAVNDIVWINFGLSDAEQVTISALVAGVSITAHFGQSHAINAAGVNAPTSASIMGISQTDQRFAWAVGAAGQGSAYWAFVWDQTLGCFSLNLSNGNYYNFCLTGCSSSTPPSGTLATTGDSCWGLDGPSLHAIHDMQMSGDGNSLLITIQSAGGGTYPNQGACAPPNPGNTVANQSIIYTVGTATTQWAYGAPNVGLGGPNSGAHQSAGVTNYLTPYGCGNGCTTGGPNIRPFSNVANFSTYVANGINPFVNVVTSDEHCSWPHPLNDDSYPWICASDLTTALNGGSLAPNYMQNVIYAWYPNNAYPPGVAPRLFSHTWSCGNTATTTCPSGIGDNSFGSQQAIGFATQKGNFFCWASTHLQSLGNDNLGHARADGWCVKLDGVNPATIMVPRQLNAVQAPLPSGPNNSHYLTVLGLNNVRLTGQTQLCGGGNSASSPCYFDTGDPPSNTGLCTPSLSFTTFDSIVAEYTLTNMLLTGVVEGGTNTWTPPCVYSQAWADASYLPYLQSHAYLPGDYIFQAGDYWQLQVGCYPGSGYDNTCVSGATPATFTGSSVTDGAVTWVNIGTHARLQDVFVGPSYKGGPSGSSCYDAAGTSVFNLNSIPVGCTTAQLYRAEPITSELPFRNWFINYIIPQVIAHYNAMPNFGYVRVGCTAGGECDPIGIGSGLYPFYGSTAGQQRAQYVSYVKILDAAITSVGPGNTNPQMILLHDLNCSAANDCLYAGQYAALAYADNFNGISTNALDVDDVENLMGNGPNNCAFPLTAASGCTTGDFAYLFNTYLTNLQGLTFWHGLQTATAETPLYCANSTVLPPSGVTGPDFSLPAGTTGCPAGYIGNLNFLVLLRTLGVGSPNTRINVNNLELYVNPPTTPCNPPNTLPNCQAGPVLLALDPSYSTSVGANAAFVPYASAEAQAFYNWLFPFNPPVDKSFVAQLKREQLHAKEEWERWYHIAQSLRFPSQVEQ